MPSSYPEYGPQYYEEKHKDIKSFIETFRAEATTLNQSFWGEAETDTRFWAGDQTLWNDMYGSLPAINRRRQFNFNHIRPAINLVSGCQRKNRKSTVCTPVENADSHTADQFTKLLMWIDRTEGVSETISEAFEEGACVTGLALLQVWLDYRSDPVSGNIRVDKKSYNSIMIDPYFRKHDLSDCQAIWTRTFVTKREAISLLPDHAELILSLPTNPVGTAKDGNFYFMPESYDTGFKKLVPYDEFYYRSYRTQKMLIDTKTGETLEWRSDDDDALNLYLKRFPQVKLQKQEVPTVRLAIQIQNVIVYDGPQPMGIDLYPFVPVLGYYAPQLPYYPYRIQGIVRGLRDAQYLYNRRKIIELDILESQVTSGYIYKESALIDPTSVFFQGQGRGIALKDTAQMTDVQPILAPNIPPAMMQISDSLGNEIQKISGINEELMGSAIDDKAGVLAMLRQHGGLTTLQSLFDQLDRSQKLLGQVMIEIIQTNWAPGKVQKILEGEQPSPQFYNKAFGKYHAAIEEGLNTTTQKQMQFAQMLQLIQAGVPIPPGELIEAATIQNKDRIIKSMEKAQQQQQQMQQVQVQAAMQEQQARTELARARAIADRGLGIERVSRVQENRALAEERRAAAVKDEQMGILNLVRALKEIDSVDLEQLEKLLTLQRISKPEFSEETATTPS